MSGSESSAVRAGPAPPAGRPLAESGLFDALFVGRLGAMLALYLAIVVGLLLSLASFTSASDLIRATQSPEIRYAFWLSLATCTLSTVFSLWVAVPAGYVLSRFGFRGKDVVDTLLDIPIVLPPLVIGLALLILFQTPLGKAIERIHPVTFAVPAVVLAQFCVACAFAVRTMRVTFDQIPVRPEQVALTLGCSRRQAFWLVVFPEARRGLITAATLSWARSLGEFGPVLVFAGATRMRTEVLPTTVFLELSAGNIEAAAAVSLIMVVAAGIVLLLTRMFGLRGTGSI